MMKYEEHLPGSSSRQLVKCYWTLTGLPNGFHEVFPDGNMDIIFNFSSPLINRKKDTDEINKAPVFVVGNLTRPLLSGCSGHYDLLGVRFRATGLQAILNHPLNEYTDLAVALEDTGAAWSKDHTEQLYPLSTQERIGRLEQWLGQFETKTDTRIHKALSIIEHTKGIISVTRLSNDVCLSPKQLQRLFLHHVGLTPKVYADTIRFKALQNILDQPFLRWEMAESLGFYDHSHLHKFFNRFTNRPLT